jgi:hypothetical protein
MEILSMRFVLNLVLCVGILAAIGCGGGGGKNPIKEATPEEIQMQKEAEKRVQTEESEMRKKQPEEMTPEQSVDQQERAREKRR